MQNTPEESFFWQKPENRKVQTLYESKSCGNSATFYKRKILLITHLVTQHI